MIINQQHIVLQHIANTQVNIHVYMQNNYVRVYPYMSIRIYSNWIYMTKELSLQAILR